mmetsp:Transcript_20369/g.28788  ORF Transcript_20369/g.28788 Transcript_20369/m.28788 type:complete len:125 (-) Transcript_20369:144-518(-)
MKSFAVLFALALVVVSTSAFAPSVSKSTLAKQATKLNIVPLKRPEGEYTYDDGLTDLERQQRTTIPAFLTGSAKSQADPSTIRDDLDDVSFELPGWFSAVGSLAGTFIFFAIFKAGQDPTSYIQ